MKNDDIKHREIESREEKFSDRAATKIWQEIPASDNPYIASRALAHGYPLEDLIKNSSYVDVFFLLFRGELPTRDESKLLETLMIGLINPGPRNDSVRAAMSAGIGKTNPMHILPIGLSVMGGSHLAAGCIFESIRFFRRNCGRDPSVLVEPAKNNMDGLTSSKVMDYCDENIPGFGCIYGGIDIQAKSLASCLLDLPQVGKALAWGADFSEKIEDVGVGWLSTGVAAATLSDLGFHPKSGGVLYQIMCAPGIAAHGLEVANKHHTSMPFVKDENYAIENNTK